jgi:hypothetical protein
MRSSNECCSPLLPDYQEVRVAFDTGGPPLTLSSPTPPPSVPPIRLYSTRRPKRQGPQQPNYAMETAASALDGKLSSREPVIYPYPPPQTTLPSGEQHTAQFLTLAGAAEPSSTLVNKTTGTEVY